MANAEAEQMQERLALVEKSIRRYRAALLGVGLIAAAGLAGPLRVRAGKTPEVIAAKEFALVDDRGQRRATLGEATRGPGLFLYDDAGRPRAALIAPKDGPGLLLYDEAGQRRAGLFATKDGPGLVLDDEAGQPRAGLDTSKDGSGRPFLTRPGSDAFCWTPSAASPG